MLFLCRFAFFSVGVAQPMGIFFVFAFNTVKIGLLNLVGYGASGAIANDPLINFTNGGYFCCCASEK